MTNKSWVNMSLCVCNISNEHACIWFPNLLRIRFLLLLLLLHTIIQAVRGQYNKIKLKSGYVWLLEQIFASQTWCAARSASPSDVTMFLLVFYSPIHCRAHWSSIYFQMRYYLLPNWSIQVLLTSHLKFQKFTSLQEEVIVSVWRPVKTSIILLALTLTKWNINIFNLTTGVQGSLVSDELHSSDSLDDLLPGCLPIWHRHCSHWSILFFRVEIIHWRERLGLVMKTLRLLVQTNLRAVYLSVIA